MGRRRLTILEKRRQLKKALRRLRIAEGWERQRPGEIDRKLLSLGWHYWQVLKGRKGGPGKKREAGVRRPAVRERWERYRAAKALRGAGDEGRGAKDNDSGTQEVREPVGEGGEQDCQHGKE